MFLLFAVIVVGEVRAESSTCDTSYSDDGDACAFYSFGCGTHVGLSQQEIPTCFNGLAQSPINLDSNSATVVDPGQLTFSGYNDQLPQTPMLRLKDFTVQLDFNQQSQRKRKRKKGGKKKRRKTRRQKKDSLKRSRKRDGATLPSISGGALGNNT